MPGSGIHGRYVRRCPAFHAVFSSATARRVVRSLPAYPIGISRSCTLSPRIRPCDASTHSSTFGRNGSIERTRRGRANGSPPASRIATYRATVFSSTPASCAAECAQRVRSYASKISITSLSDLVTVPPDRTGFRWQARANPIRRATAFIDERWECSGDLVTTDPEHSCPQGRTQLSAYPDFPVSAGRPGSKPPAERSTLREGPTTAAGSCPPRTTGSQTVPPRSRSYVQRGAPPGPGRHGPAGRTCATGRPSHQQQRHCAKYMPEYGHGRTRRRAEGLVK